MIFFACAFNSNALFEAKKYLFEFEGIKFVFYPGGIEFCDVIQTLLEKESQKDKAFTLMNKFLLSFGWVNNVQFKFISGFSLNHPRADLFKMGRRLDVRRNHFNNVGFLSMGDNYTEHQCLALSLYNDALISEDSFYKFFSLWKILDINNPSDKPEYIVQWINKVSEEEKFDICLQLLEWARTNNKTLGQYLKDFARNSIAHVGNKNAVFSFKACDIERIAYANTAMEDLARYYMKQVLGLNNETVAIKVLNTEPKGSV